MAMLSHRLRRVLVAAPSYFQRSFTLSRPSDFITPVSSLLPRSAVKQSAESNRSPTRLFSTAQYQYDPYTGEDSFTPDNEGCDFNHWLITMNFPKDNLPSRDEMVSIFEQTCAKGLGLSLEEAKKKIYAICTTSYQGFQATMTIGEVEKFRDLPGVQYIIPDSYVDVENKVYGGDKYENGVITPGPVPVPTKEGFDSLEKGQDKAQRSEASSDQGLTPGEELAQIIEVPPDQRSLKQMQGTLALGQGQGQGTRTSIPRQGQGEGQRSRMPIPVQGQSRGEGSRMPSFQGSFKQSQGTPSVGQGQTQRSVVPSFQGSVKEGQDIRIHGQGQAQQSQVPSFQGSFKQGQETPTLRQGQAQRSQMPSFQSGNNQGEGRPVPGQRQGQGSQIPSNQVGYSQGQGPQTPPYQGLPNNYAQGPRQGASVYYSQGAPQANFVQGTPENYNQMGQGNYTPQSVGNCGPAQGAGSPGFGHGYPGNGQGQGGQLLSPYQGSYNQGQGTPVPGQGQEGQIPSYQTGYSQGLGASVPTYQVTPGNYGHWAFVNYNQGPPHGNFHQGPQPNYIQGGQWNYSPQNGGHYGPAQFGQWYPGPTQGQGNQMPQYQLGYNQGQGPPFPGQCRCQGCGMPSYQWSYNQGQGTQIPGQWQGQGYGMPSYQASYHGNFNQATPGSYGQGTSAVKPANYNMQNGGIYGPTHGSAGTPGFAQGYTGHRQNETFQQVDQKNVAGDWSNNNPANPTDTRKPNS
ncbi:PREDICTED: multiple organellar RNA editing factor 4, mitochondrial-like [Camelina sativa]|uniref:Multiple organellar RNA editing factor 4, mitochondrial-like n=1 Tax=Camelina sativa TaxID=90675 RepID=A0ABM0UIY7_CAMSA|nr:PREDICTED: multiple organellar RNA editing factor 4, mitochondrial-like [Camelina sativa]